MVYFYGARLKYIIILAFYLLLMCLLMLPLGKSEAADIEQKVVKVGWYFSNCFQEGMFNELPKGGYSYEYLQKVSDYNGWKLEYVYGEWSELLKKLKTGEVDVMAGVSATDERKEYMFFPEYPMGTDRYYIYQHADNKVMDSHLPASMDGKKIGCIYDNRMTFFAEKWAREHEVNLEFIYFSGFEERDKAFARGELDGVAAIDNSVLYSSGMSPVTKTGEELFYLAVSKKRPDLLRDLDYSLNIMQEMDPYFLQNLLYNNYVTTITNGTLSDMEKNWLSGHSVLKVGCIKDYLPYCAVNKDGNIYGLIKDVFDSILKQLDISDKLQIEYTVYDNYESMITAVRNGDVDAVFPVGGGVWNIDKDGIDSSTPVVTAGMDLVYKGRYGEWSLNKIAVNKNNKLQYYFIKANYPRSKFIECNSINECLEMVLEGTAGSTIVNGLRVDIIREGNRYNSLYVLQLEKTDNRCIGVKDGNAALLLLLDRGLRIIGRDYGANASYNYVNNLYTSEDFIRDNLVTILSLILLVVLIILYLINKNAQYSKKQAKEKEELNQLLTEALDEAEKANRAKTIFLFNMSHDIRTPMNAIIGFADILKKNADNRESVINYVTKIQTASEVLLSLINNVLEIARIESGNEKLDETYWNAKAFNDILNSIFITQMKEKEIEFISTMDVQHYHVMCDELKVREVLLNILSNAYKYTPRGGRITMSLKELPSDTEGVVIYQTTISDTGIGMSADFLPHIFDEFSRERSSTESRTNGTGLGMQIVKRYVELMNGTIDIESTIGLGTTITIQLPHRIVEPPSTESVISDEVSEEKDDGFAGRRILLAEDNEFNAEIAITILEEAGFEIERAEDGVECVKMLQEAEAGYYDVILMDIQMPNMDGLGAARTIRCLDDKERNAIPIIAMTANAFEEDRRNALEAGMNDHLAKPIEIPKLMEALAKVLRK